MQRVLLVDHNTLVRAGIRNLLEKVRDVRVVAEAASVEEALTFVRQQPVDLIVLEWSMPGLGGLELIPKLIRQQPLVKVVVVTDNCEAPFPNRLLKAGAIGFISKAATLDEFTMGMKSVAAGRIFVSAEVAQRMACSIMAQDCPFDELSDREMQVMKMMTEGLGLHDISQRLCLSPKTVSTYRYRMYEKLGISSEVALTRLALRYGLLDRHVHIMHPEAA